VAPDVGCLSLILPFHPLQEKTDMARHARWIGGVLTLLTAAFAASPASAEPIFAITTNAAQGTQGVNLIRFDSASPAAFTTIGGLTGVVAGHGVRGIDLRPADSQIYALSTSNTTPSEAALYTVNQNTGALTQVGGLINLAGTTGPRVSIDFNPQADRLRVVSGNSTTATPNQPSLSYRVNPIPGALVAQDANPLYDPADVNAATNPPFVVGVAYTNNVPNATATTLFAWDSDQDVLARIGSVNGTPISPNAGTMFTIGGPPTFITASGAFGFDISGQTGTAYINYDDITNGGATSFFATVNLANGAVTNIGAFPAGTFVLDITAAVPEPSSLALVGLVVAAAAVRSRRLRK